MSLIYQLMMITIAKRHLGKDRVNRGDYVITKQLLELEVTATRLLKDIVFISLGILAAGFGLKGFLLPNGLVDGAVTGISLLAEAITESKLIEH